MRLKIIRFILNVLTRSFIAALMALVCWFYGIHFAIYLCYNCAIRLQICWWQIY